MMAMQAQRNRMDGLLSLTINRMDEASAESRVQSLVLGTWIPVAAIAHLAALPTKTALAILQRRQHEWMLECRRVRIDGHNSVHIWRKRNPERQLVMGVWCPIAREPEPEEA